MLTAYIHMKFLEAQKETEIQLVLFWSWGWEYRRYEGMSETDDIILKLHFSDG